MAALVDKGRVKEAGKEDPNWSKISPFIRYALIAADEALKQANWHPTLEEDRERTGVHIGRSCRTVMRYR